MTYSASALTPPSDVSAPPATPAPADENLLAQLIAALQARQASAQQDAKNGLSTVNDDVAKQDALTQISNLLTKMAALFKSDENSNDTAGNLSASDKTLYDSYSNEASSLATTAGLTGDQSKQYITNTQSLASIRANSNLVNGLASTQGLVVQAGMVTLSQSNNTLNSVEQQQSAILKALLDAMASIIKNSG